MPDSQHLGSRGRMMDDQEFKASPGYKASLSSLGYLRPSQKHKMKSVELGGNPNTRLSR